MSLGHDGLEGPTVLLVIVAVSEIRLLRQLFYSARDNEVEKRIFLENESTASDMYLLWKEI